MIIPKIDKKIKTDVLHMNFINFKRRLKATEKDILEE